MCLKEAISALLTGEVPQSVIDNGTPTNVVHVLDMAWILPATVLTALWLWRGRAIGYTLAGTLLTFLSLLALAISSMILFMTLYGQAVSVGPAAIFVILSVISLWMLVHYLKGLKEN